MPDKPELPVNETIPLLKGSVTKTFYSVQSGDNLWNIAKSQNMTFDEIINLNPKFTRDGRNPNRIYPGEQVEVVVPNDGIVVTAKGKKERVEERKKLIEDGENRIAELKKIKQENMDTGCFIEPKCFEELENAVERFKRNNYAVEYIRMSDNTYLDDSKVKELEEKLASEKGREQKEKIKEQIKEAKKNMPEKSMPQSLDGYRRSSQHQPENLPKDLRNITWEDPETGFRAVFYQSEFDNRVVVSFQGSNEMKDFTLANIPQAVGLETEQYKQAIELGKKVQEWAIANDKELVFIGHSLGGGLAQASGIVTERPAVTFNAAGVHENTLKPYKKARVDGKELVNNYFARGELLTSLQSVPVKAAIATAATLLELSPIPNGLGIFILSSLAKGDIPPSTGKMHELVLEGEADKLDPIAKHSALKEMEQVMEKEKKEDQEKIKWLLKTCHPYCRA